MAVSIIICAHDSCVETLKRVIDACLLQISGEKNGDIVVIDNASTVPISDAIDARGSRIVREERAGLGFARARGVRETNGEVLIFVDDDTVLASDYVSAAVRILRERAYLGTIGGQLLPQFKSSLVLPERYYWERLALRRFTGSHWSNRWDDFRTSPIGGGMVIRRDVAEEWVRRFEATPWRQGLGRTGRSMAGAEDVDQNRTSCDMGYGKGVFEELTLTHVIPAERLQPEFLVRITEGNARSWAFIRGMLEPSAAIPPRTAAHRAKVLAEAYRKRGIDRALLLAEERGTAEGWREVARYRAQLP